jgi:hypothetical protein
MASPRRRTNQFRTLLGGLVRDVSFQNAKAYFGFALPKAAG